MITKINTKLQSKFTLLLLSLVSFILLSPYVGNTLITKFLLLFIILFVFAAVMFAIPQQRSHLIFFIGFALISFLMHCLYVINPNGITASINAICFTLFCLIAAYIFINDIMNHKIVTQDVLMGSLCVYLLIGMAYSYIYVFIEIAHPDSFMITASHQTPSNFEFLYFSFITLTTLGYGDIVSTSVYSKSFVILESVTGVFYIAILVARLVSAFVRQVE